MSHNSRIDHWREQVLSHEVWLRKFVSRRVACSHTADDVFQEVIAIALHEDLDRESIKHPAGWLYGVAVRQVARQTSRRKDSPLDDESMSADTSPLPIEMMIQIENQDSVRAAFAKLDAADQRLLTLLYIERKTYSQIGEIIAASRNQVIYLVRRARQTFTQQLSHLKRDES